MLAPCAASSFVRVACVYRVLRAGQVMKDNVNKALTNVEQLAEVSVPRTVPTHLVVRQSCAMRR